LQDHSFKKGGAAMASGKEYEIFCESIIRKMFSNRHYRVSVQKRVAKTLKRVDISIAERKPGGRHYVFDCKDYRLACLGTMQLAQVEAYRRDTRASKAALLIPEYTEVPGNIAKKAAQMGIKIICVRRTKRTGIRGFVDELAQKKSISNFVG
jgi:hypothetical protein